MKTGTASKNDAVTKAGAICGILVPWQGDWALGCDFTGGDIGNVQVPGDQCGGKCRSTAGCTHFTWTGFNGGTCWMKGGAVSKADAIATGDTSMTCGVTVPLFALLPGTPLVGSANTSAAGFGTSTAGTPVSFVTVGAKANESHPTSEISTGVWITFLVCGVVGAASLGFASAWFLQRRQNGRQDSDVFVSTNEPGVQDCDCGELFETVVVCGSSAKLPPSPHSGLL